MSNFVAITNKSPIFIYFLFVLELLKILVVGGLYGSLIIKIVAKIWL
jgi:hypothetical protein